MPRGVLAAALLFSGAAASTLRGPSAFEPLRRLDADHVGRHLGAVFVELVADKLPISSNVSLEFTPIFPVGGALPGEDDGHYLSVLGMSKDNATALHAACPVTKGIISASCLNEKEDLFYWEAEVKPTRPTRVQPAGTAVPPDPKDVDPNDVLLVPTVANGSVNATITFTEESKGLTLLFLNVGIKEVAVQKLERVTAGKAATPVPDFTLPAAVVEPKPKRA